MHKHSLPGVTAILSLLAPPSIVLTQSYTPESHTPKRRRARIVSTYTPAKPFSDDPNINRWTGLPHGHSREIARNLRREAKRTSDITDDDWLDPKFIEAFDDIMSDENLVS